MDLFVYIFSTIYSISNLFRMSYCVFFSISFRTQQNTHEKKQLKMQDGTYGMYWPDYLQSLLRLQKGESATITSHSELIKRLTDPILRPQPTTV
jgi:hypothetical protein